MGSVLLFPSGVDARPSALATKREIAQHLRVSERTIERWTARRGLPRIRVGPNTVRYRLADVAEWATSNIEGSQPC